ncbi:Maf-like protein isoform X2 [Tanacetum coccineum]
MGRTKTKFDNLILDIASLESYEIVGSDSCIWNLSNDDTFSVNKVRKHIDERSLPMLSQSTRWYKMIPKRVNIFMWRMFLDRLPNRLNLSSRGLDVDSFLAWFVTGLLNQIRIPFSLVILLLLFGGLFDLGLVFRSQPFARVKTRTFGLIRGMLLRTRSLVLIPSSRLPVGPLGIILGSSSIARRKILAEMGYEFTLMSADIDEKAIRTEKPEELVMALAKAKADAIVSKLQLSGDHEKDAKPSILIASDTVVVYEGMIREKPSNEEEAREFIKGYSGKQAATVSSVFVTNLKTGFTKGDFDKVEINFHEIPDHAIEKLLEEGLVLRVAGALIIEHPLIVPYVKEVIGTTDSVMGLPKALTEKLLKEAAEA